MGSIERRVFMKSAVAGALACTIEGSQVLFSANQARAQASVPRVSPWPNRRMLDVLGLDHPIIQAPMAGYVGSEMAVAVLAAGGLGSLPCGLLTPKQVRDEMAKIRAQTNKPINLNFFCHRPKPDEAADTAWRKRLAPYYVELGLDPTAPITPPPLRRPFDADMCDVVVELKPEIVSFLFGLPEAALIKKLKAAGCFIVTTATTVAEGRWLEEHGADAVIAQGAEAGGHRGMFLTNDAASQVGTFALVPQMADALKIPVIAAGGIADGRGIAAALTLGASAVQMGTAFLFCPESRASALHRTALKTAHDDSTALTNVFTGRAARATITRFVREQGPLAELVPSYPFAANAVQPLRVAAESRGSVDYTYLPMGQAAPLGRPLAANELTRKLAAEAIETLGKMGRASSVDAD
jgi:nitronate monooxygenase